MTALRHSPATNSTHKALQVRTPRSFSVHFAFSFTCTCLCIAVCCCVYLVLVSSPPPPVFPLLLFNARSLRLYDTTGQADVERFPSVTAPSSDVPLITLCTLPETLVASIGALLCCVQKLREVERERGGKEEERCECVCVCVGVWVCACVFSDTVTDTHRHRHTHTQTQTHTHSITPLLSHPLVCTRVFVHIVAWYRRCCDCSRRQTSRQDGEPRGNRYTVLCCVMITVRLLPPLQFVVVCLPRTICSHPARVVCVCVLACVRVCVCACV